MSTNDSTTESEAGYSVEEAADLALGENVCVRVLRSRPDLTGRLGMVVRPYNPSTGRIVVQLEGEAAPMALKPHALEGSGLPDGVRRMILPVAPAVEELSATVATAKRQRVCSSSSGDGASCDKPKENRAAQEATLFAGIHEILSAGDLNRMTLREVRQQLLGRPDVSPDFVADNKPLIKRMVAKAISHLQQSQATAPTKRKTKAGNKGK